jgi:predicted ribosome quality control (RQC) complex YloA/Tae2 family protein
VQTTITSQGHAPNTTNTDTTKKSSKKTRPQKQSQIQNPTSRSARDKDRKKRMKAHVVIEHVDMIKEAFWERRPWILSGRTG